MFQQLLKAIFFPQKFCQMNNFSYFCGQLTADFAVNKPQNYTSLIIALSPHGEFYPEILHNTCG